MECQGSTSKSHKPQPKGLPPDLGSESLLSLLRRANGPEEELEILKGAKGEETERGLIDWLRLRWACGANLALRSEAFRVLEELSDRVCGLAAALLGLAYKAALKTPCGEAGRFLRGCLARLAKRDLIASRAMLFAEIPAIRNAVLAPRTAEFCGPRGLAQASTLTALAASLPCDEASRALRAQLFEAMLALAEARRGVDGLPLALHLLGCCTRLAEPALPTLLPAVVRLVKAACLRLKAPFAFSGRGGVSFDPKGQNPALEAFLLHAFSLLKRVLSGEGKTEMFDAYCMVILRFYQVQSRLKENIFRRREIMKLLRMTALAVKSSKQIDRPLDVDGVLKFQMLNDLSSNTRSEKTDFEGRGKRGGSG